MAAVVAREGATRESVCVLELVQRVLSRVAPAEVVQLAMPDGLHSRMMHMQERTDKRKQTGFSRMQECRDALILLDDRGWKRSYHQRLFHDDFLKACTRIFWKLEAPGTFERQHCDILRRNNWEHLQQEILISTPRRFGKTISVSMFAAAMLFSAPNVEISIYSTCKRISQKLLNKVQQFFGVICGNDLKKRGFTVTRSNMEEIVLLGPEGPADIRVVNSYPSKIGTTKGTGGDILILEEAAYCDEGFFYETVAPILSVGSASLVAISTLTSEINFYTRLIKMIDPCTGRACFTTRCIELVCAQCKESGRSHECVHMLHLVPRWQSAEKHRKLKIMMQDRPDLIRSELAGLAFSSLQQVFRQVDIDAMFAASTLPFVQDEDIFLVIDPAAGGPSSDYAVVSFTRQRGVITVIGVDTLSECKEPSKQFALVERHIRRLRKLSVFRMSVVVIMCERNLGFEAEHHERALRGVPYTRHRVDHGAKRFGVLTTEDIKHGMCTLTNTMLREQRVNVCKPLMSEDPAGSAKRLHEQLTIYSLQFKEAANVFSKTRASLSGKVGGMKDDVVIALQLGIYYTNDPSMYR